MQVKRFKGRSVPDVMKKVRDALGPEAVIIQTQVSRRTGPLRWLGGDRVEVVAGAGFAIVSPYVERRIRTEPLLPAARAAGRGPGRAPATDADDTAAKAAGLSAYLRAAVPSLPLRAADAPGATGAAPRGAAPPAAALPHAVESELRDLRRMLQSVQDRVVHGSMDRCPPELFQEYVSLMQGAVSDELARRMIRDLEGRMKPDEVRDPRAVRDAVRSTLERMIPVTGPIRLRKGRCTRVMFIGPTGVGKTTTIAKLAAQHHCFERQDVALVTCDDYRLAATEQLQKFATILRIPLRVAASPQELPGILEELKGYDLVLIDTAGRSQRDGGKMSELKSLLASARPDEVHLVVSLTTHPDNLLEIVQRFASCRVDALVLTKLDEATRFGLIVDVLGRVEKSLSYVTTGQNVPRDIEVASPGRLSKLIVGDSARA